MQRAVSPGVSIAGTWVQNTVPPNSGDSLRSRQDAVPTQQSQGLGSDPQGCRDSASSVLSSPGLPTAIVTSWETLRQQGSRKRAEGPSLLCTQGPTKLYQSTPLLGVGSVVMASQAGERGLFQNRSSYDPFVGTQRIWGGTPSPLAPVALGHAGPEPQTFDKQQLPLLSFHCGPHTGLGCRLQMGNHAEG